MKRKLLGVSLLLLLSFPSFVYAGNDSDDKVEESSTDSYIECWYKSEQSEATYKFKFNATTNQITADLTSGSHVINQNRLVEDDFINQETNTLKCPNNIYITSSISGSSNVQHKFTSYKINETSQQYTLNQQKINNGSVPNKVTCTYSNEDNYKIHFYLDTLNKSIISSKINGVTAGNANNPFTYDEIYNGSKCSDIKVYSSCYQGTCYITKEKTTTNSSGLFSTTTTSLPETVCDLTSDDGSLKFNVTKQDSSDNQSTIYKWSFEYINEFGTNISRSGTGLQSLHDNSAYNNIFSFNTEGVYGVYTDQALQDLIKSGNCPKFVYAAPNVDEDSVGLIFSSEKIEEAKEYLAEKGFAVKNAGNNTAANLGTDVTGCDVVPKVVRKWIKIALNFVKYIALALVIVLGTLDFIKAAGSGEPDSMKKAGQSFLKRVIAVIILFLLPMIVDLILHLINLYGSTGDCFGVFE